MLIAAFHSLDVHLHSHSLTHCHIYYHSHANSNFSTVINIDGSRPSTRSSTQLGPNEHSYEVILADQSY